MKSRLITGVAWGSLIVAISLWVAFAYLVRELSSLRAVYAAEELSVAQDEERSRSAVRLHALVRDSGADQEVLEDFARTDVIRAVETIEMAGKAVGVSVVVRSATAALVKGATKSFAVKDLRAVDITVDAEGKFLSLIKAASLFEALPLLASVDRLEFEERQGTPDGKKTADSWRMTARIRIITTSPVGI